MTALLPDPALVEARGGRVDLDAEPAVPVANGHRPLVRARRRYAWWPLSVMMLGTPFWFVLGMHQIVWLLVGIPTGFALIRKRRVVLPRPFGIYLVFLGWMCLSAVSLTGATKFISWGYRAGLFFVFAALLLWLANMTEEEVPTQKVVRIVGGFWIIVMIFGYLGLIYTDTKISTPIQKILPASVRDDGFVKDLTDIRFSENRGIKRAISVPRPSAPFPYTNGWGAAMGLLTPFFILSWLIPKNTLRRVVGVLLLIAGINVMILSLNRGLWLSLSAGVGYIALRNAFRGRMAMIGWLAAIAAVAVGVLVFTPAGDRVSQRLGQSGEESNATRENLYKEAIDLSKTSPFVGVGTPQPKVEGGPPVGTHGLVWFILVAFGYPAVILFGLYIVMCFFRSFRAPTDTAMWMHATILVFAIQFFFYGLLPQFILVSLAIGLAWREHANWAERQSAASESHVLGAVTPGLAS